MPDLSLNTTRQINRPDILFSVARVPNSNRLLVGSSLGKVLELDAGQNNPTARELADHGRYVTCVRLAGNTVVSGGYDSKLIWWDLERSQVIRTVANAHSRYIRQIAVSPDGSKFASVADDMVCRVWNVATGELIHELRGHALQTPTHFNSMLYAATFSPDGRLLATGDRIGHVVVWDVNTGRQRTTVEAPELYTWDGRQRIRSIGGIRALAFSPNGNHLAVGGVGQINNVDGLGGPTRVEVFDWARAMPLYHFTGQNGMINALAYHPDNRWLCGIGGESNGRVIFNRPADHETIHQGNMPTHVQDFTFNENYSTFYAVGHRKIVVVDIRNDS